MTESNWFRKLNNLELPVSDNVNTVINAILALIMVLAMHEWIEGLFIRDLEVLRISSVEALIFMRSHGSLRKMWALINGYRWEKGQYHSPNCRCHVPDSLDLDPDDAKSICEPASRPMQVKKRLLAITFLVRIIIVIVEVIAIVLAINHISTKFVVHGAYALTPISNKAFGTLQEIQPKLGCEPILKAPEDVNTEHLNRIAQLTVCTRLHRPFELRTNFTPAPNGFEPFFLYIDLSGDKVTFSHAGKGKVGAEMYAYWSVECSETSRDNDNKCESIKIPEGVVASVVHGALYSMKRDGEDTLNKTKEAKEIWRRELDEYLRLTFPHAYRTAYPPSATSWADEEGKRPHPVPRMLLHFNLTAVEYLNQDPVGDPDATIGLLLQKIVGLRYRSNATKYLHADLIWHSDGIKMVQAKKPVLEYKIVRPIIGTVLWMVLLFVAMLLRWALGYAFPNNFYELVLYNAILDSENNDRAFSENERLSPAHFAHIFRDATSGGLWSVQEPPKLVHMV